MRKRSIYIILILAIIIALSYYFRYFLTALFYIGLSQIYPPDLNYVRENTWVYEEGFKIGEGDFVEFEEGDTLFQLRHDTIFYHGEPRAIVTSTNKYFYQMKIKSSKDNQSGEYANTEEFTH